jgi:hypothetical protein
LERSRTAKFKAGENLLSNKKSNDIKESTSTVETIPVKNQLSKEEIQFQKLLQFANLAKYIKRDLNSTQQIQYTFHKNFSKDDVMKWMANPKKFSKQLRNLSRFLYDTSSHYKRLVQYFATMLTFDYIVEPYGIVDYTLTQELIENVRKKYINIINFIDIMNIKHEFLKLCERAWIDDIVYAYEFRLKDSYFLDTLNPDYCEVIGIEDGCLTFQFDFQYFNSYPDELERYGEEFKKKYELYKHDTKNKRWQELDSNKTICIKIAESVDYPIPPFSGIFEEVYAIEDYKQLKLAKTELENYLLLVAKIPYLKDAKTANEFALEMNKAIEYFNLAMDSLPEQVGGMLSPFESVEAVKVDRSDKNSDSVSEAQKALYDSAGVSQLLFNSTGTGAAITKSILVDQTVSFKVLRQFERWVNKKLKDENKVIKFKATFLDITKYNQPDVIDSYKNAATLGLPCKMEYCAAVGKSPSSVLNTMFLENDVLGIVDKFIPLSSSYTQVGNDKNGKPQANEDDLSDNGKIARDLDTNNPDNRAI